MIKDNHAGFDSYTGFGLNFLSEHDLESIHLATLKILEKTGIWVQEDDAIDILEAGGAIVDRSSRIVKFPPHIVEAAIDSAPKQVYLAGRDPKHDVVLESNRVHFVCFGVGVTIYDLETGEYREGKLADIERTSKLIDALEHFDILFPVIAPSDVDPAIAPLYMLEAHLKNSTKPIVATGEGGGTSHAIIEMAGAVVGGIDKLRERPIIIGGGCPQSPLAFPREMTSEVIPYTRVGLPVLCLSMAMSGGSAPVTLAGTLEIGRAHV